MLIKNYVNIKRKCDICYKEGNSKQIVFIKKINTLCCKKHMHQYEIYGKFLDINPRTIQDKNEIILYFDYAEIILYNTKSEEIARTIIDIEFIDKVKNIKWCFDGIYCIGDTNNGGILLHRFILNLRDNDKNFVDHINRNSLDNRKNNLRLCNNEENSRNAKISKNNTTGIIGISFSKERKKYEAKINVKYKTINLGRYVDIKDAIIARLKAEKQYFGEFAPQQYLFEQYNI
jgi:hypothetical protein